MVEQLTEKTLEQEEKIQELEDEKDDLVMIQETIIDYSEILYLLDADSYYDVYIAICSRIIYYQCQGNILLIFSRNSYF